MIKEEKRKVGRPKLADSKLKKVSIIMCMVCLVLIIGLVILGIYKLDIIKLKGDASDKFETGDMFCLGTECFYTIREDGNKVIALAQYNLLVGNYYYDENVSEIESDSPGYGLQSEIAKGFDDTDYSIGGVPFAKDNDDHQSYWWDYSSNKIKDGYPTGADATAYVYSDDSPIKGYVDLYQETLNKKYNSLKARLLNHKDFLHLSCGDANASTTCGMPKQTWFYKTTYWTGFVSTGDFESVDKKVAVFAPPSVSETVIMVDFYEDIGVGIRPVIEIDKSEIPSDRGMKYNNYEIGDVVKIGSEEFNVISQTEEEITLLAKYNLLVGNEVDVALNDGNYSITSSSEISKDTEGYGLQNSSIESFEGNPGHYKAVVSYATPRIVPSETEGEEDKYLYYWQDDDGNLMGTYSKSFVAQNETINYGYTYDKYSNVYQYLQDYKKKLMNFKNLKTVNIKLLDVEDYVNLVMSPNVSDWYLPSTYWTGVTIEVDTMMALTRDDSAYYYPNQELAGVRPVVTIKKSELEGKDVIKTTTKQKIITGTSKKASKKYRLIYHNEDNKTTTTTKTGKTTTVMNMGGIVKTYNTESKIPWLFIIIDGLLLLVALIEFVIYKNKKKEN